MACKILPRCIYGAGRLGNWKVNFVGSPMCTVSDGISSAAPWLMLPPSFEDDGGKMSYNLYSPVDKKVTRVSKRRSSITIGEEEIIRLESAVLAGSSHGWLALYKGFDLFLYNPISDRQIKLPPVWGTLPEKVILSCPPPDESNSWSCRAILCYGPRGNMAVCCPGLSTEWTPFGALFHEGEKLNDILKEARIERSYEDFVYSTQRKQLFCVTRYGDLEAWDIGGDRLSPKLNWKTNDDDMDYDEENYPWHARSQQEDALKESCPALQYLVFSEHSDQLFLVKRYLMEGKPGEDKEERVGFDVYEIIIKEGGGELRYMDGAFVHWF